MKNLEFTPNKISKEYWEKRLVRTQERTRQSKKEKARESHIAENLIEKLQKQYPGEYEVTYDFFQEPISDGVRQSGGYAFTVHNDNISTTFFLMNPSVDLLKSEADRIINKWKNKI